MAHLLLVGVGGFLGSIARYGLSTWLQHRLTAATFPYGTLAVNVIGCCVIGLLSGLAETRGLMRSETRLLLMVGLCGGFTTFSTFGYDTLGLLHQKETAAALVNVGAQVVLGLGGVWLGMVAARLIGGSP